MNMLLTILVLLVTSSLSSSSSSSSCNFPAIFNFGDSNSDTGGIAAAFFPQTTPSPYGSTFFLKPSGRASDGRHVIDFLADHLGLPYLSPYLDSVGSNYLHGANFATGGATILRSTKSWFQDRVSPFNFEIQVEQFSQFKDKATQFYNQEKDGCAKKRLPKPEDFSKALFTIDIGQNDAYPDLKNTSLQALPSAIAYLVNQHITQVKNLYQKGARAFWIHNLGPIGCMPSVKIKTPNPSLDNHGCVKSYNHIAGKFNKELKDGVVKLRSKFSDATLIYVDMFSAKFELITNAKSHGFEDPFKICCGYHGIDYDIWCGEKSKLNGSEVFAGSCPYPSKVISWDGIHYSEAANHWISKRIANGSLSDPPIGIANACTYKQMRKP